MTLNLTLGQDQPCITSLRADALCLSDFYSEDGFGYPILALIRENQMVSLVLDAHPAPLRRKMSACAIVDVVR